MSKRKVVATKNLPSKPPLFPSITLWLLLDRLQAVGWVWGVVCTLMGILWVTIIVDTFNKQEVDILNNTKDKQNV